MNDEQRKLLEALGGNALMVSHLMDLGIHKQIMDAMASAQEKGLPFEVIFEGLADFFIGQITLPIIRALLEEGEHGDRLMAARVVADLAKHTELGFSKVAFAIATGQLQNDMTGGNDA